MASTQFFENDLVWAKVVMPQRGRHLFWPARITRPLWTGDGGRSSCHFRAWKVASQVHVQLFNFPLGFGEDDDGVKKNSRIKNVSAFLERDSDDEEVSEKHEEENKKKKKSLWVDIGTLVPFEAMNYHLRFKNPDLSLAFQEALAYYKSRNTIPSFVQDFLCKVEEDVNQLQVIEELEICDDKSVKPNGEEVSLDRHHQCVDEKMEVESKVQLKEKEVENSSEEQSKPDEQGSMDPIVEECKTEQSNNAVSKEPIAKECKEEQPNIEEVLEEHSEEKVVDVDEQKENKKEESQVFGGWNRLMTSMREAIPQTLKSAFGSPTSQQQSPSAGGVRKGLKRKAEDNTPSDKENKVRKVAPASSPRMKGSFKALTVDEITDEMLAAIPVKSSQKKKAVTDEEKGRCQVCHQCRQKTLDLKTICRKGATGCTKAYCGICLKNIYGQDIRVVLKDAVWKCPFCHGECQCSICIKKTGSTPNGALVKEARAKGFGSVLEYKKHRAAMAADTPTE